jgi:hypothetical protein
MERNSTALTSWPWSKVIKLSRPSCAKGDGEPASRQSTCRDPKAADLAAWRNRTEDKLTGWAIKALPIVENTSSVRAPFKKENRTSEPQPGPVALAGVQRVLLALGKDTPVPRPVSPLLAD